MPKSCSVCGEDSDEHVGAYILNGEFMCRTCFKNHDFHGKPFFVQHIPPMVEDADSVAFTFEDETQLVQKLKEMGYPPENSAIMQTDGDTIMYRSTDADFWWVIGFVHNFNLANMNIPVWNRK